MRKFLVPLMLMLLALSCKKEEKKDPNADLFGKWYPVKETYIESEHEGGALKKTDTTVFIGQPGEYLYFVNTDDVIWHNLEKGSTSPTDVWYGTEFETVNMKYQRAGTKLTVNDDVSTREFNITRLDAGGITIEFEESSTYLGVTNTTKGKLEYKK